jgi:Tol biopolymer transport system component
MTACHAWAHRMVLLGALGSAACDSTSPSQDTPGPALIAFTAIEHDDEASSDIFVVALDGSGLRRLTSSPDFEGEPAWSPDGSQLVFVRSQHGLDNDLYRIDADGTDLVRLTSGGGDHRRPSWSPDGSRIVLTRDYQIATIRPDGSDFTLLDVASDMPLEYPVWSPDGSLIAYVGSTGGGGRQVFVMEGDGTNPRPLTTAVGTTMYVPTWHPDGERLVYARGPGRLQLYQVNLDGSIDEPIRPGELEGEFDPQVSPDGQRLLLARQAADAEGPSRLYVAPFGEGEPIAVPLQLPGSHSSPRWHFPEE